MRFQLAQRHLAPVADTDPCTLEHSDVPMNHLASAALANLDEWVTRGVAPPRAERLQVDASTHTPARDAVGNALGGIRVAQLDVPLATYAVATAEASAECAKASGPFLRIRRIPLSRERLLTLYGSEAEFNQRFAARVRELVAARWLLPEDGDLEIEAARTRAATAFRAH
jgi:hypothetical protein